MLKIDLGVLGQQQLHQVRAAAVGQSQQVSTTQRIEENESRHDAPVGGDEEGRGAVEGAHVDVGLAGLEQSLDDADVALVAGDQEGRESVHGLIHLRAGIDAHLHRIPAQHSELKTLRVWLRANADAPVTAHGCDEDRRPAVVVRHMDQRRAELEEDAQDGPADADFSSEEERRGPADLFVCRSTVLQQHSVAERAGQGDVSARGRDSIQVKRASVVIGAYLTMRSLPRITAMKRGV